MICLFWGEDVLRSNRGRQEPSDKEPIQYVGKKVEAGLAIPLREYMHLQGLGCYQKAALRILVSKPVQSS